MERDLRLVESYNGAGEAQVVPGYQLAAELQAWCKAWLSERPLAHKAEGQHGGAEFVGPVQWLAAETGLSVRQVSRICNGELVTVGHRQAELLLMATDREYLLGNGAIQVVPNQNWSLEKFINWKEQQGCV